MPSIRVSASGDVPAPAPTVYHILADYRTHHPAILPRPPFGDLVVEQGGRGAGTVIRFPIRLLGETREVRALVSEPAPGRELAETDLTTGARTSFVVEPIPDGTSKVTIATEWATPGFRGWAEKLLAPPLLRRLYLAELANLASYSKRVTL